MFATLCLYVPVLIMGELLSDRLRRPQAAVTAGQSCALIIDNLIIFSKNLDISNLTALMRISSASPGGWTPGKRAPTPGIYPGFDSKLCPGGTGKSIHLPT